MATVQITISSPTLVGAEKFKTRYRKLPSGAWSSYVDRTNAAFSLVGLDDYADYQLEIIFVDADGTECPAKYEYFTTYADADCLTFSPSIQCEDNVAFLQLDYTFPSPYTIPPCGYIIRITQNGVTTTINKPSGFNIVGQEFYTLASADDIRLEISKNLCNGIELFCEDLSVLGIECGCTPLVISSADVINVGGSFPWLIRIFYTNSIPATPFVKVTYTQTNTVNTGVVDSGVQNFPTPIGPSGHTFKGNPNMNGNFETPSYKGTIIDGCGIVHAWQTP